MNAPPHTTGPGGNPWIRLFETLGVFGSITPGLLEFATAHAEVDLPCRSVLGYEEMHAISFFCLFFLELSLGLSLSSIMRRQCQSEFCTLVITHQKRELECRKDYQIPQKH